MKKVSELYPENYLSLEDFRTYATCMHEINFCFLSDSREVSDRWMGYMEADHYTGFWVGGCDIPDGTDFQTFDEMISSPIYDGLSLKKRWDEVQIFSIDGCSVTDFFEWSIKKGYRRI